MSELFSEKEIEFLSFCWSDLTYSEIAEKMNISKRTAENYAYRLCEKLNINTRIGLAVYAYRSNIGTFKSSMYL